MTEKGSITINISYTWLILILKQNGVLNAIFNFKEFYNEMDLREIPKVSFLDIFA